MQQSLRKALGNRTIEPTSNAHENEAHINSLLAYVINSALGTPAQLTSALINELPLLLKGQAQVWLDEQRNAGVVWPSLDAFAAAYKERFCKMVRFKKQDARMQLVNGEIKQGDLACWH